MNVILLFDYWSETIYTVERFQKKNVVWATEQLEKGANPKRRLSHYAERQIKKIWWNVFLEKKYMDMEACKVQLKVSPHILLFIFIVCCNFETFKEQDYIEEEGCLTTNTRQHFYYQKYMCEYVGIYANLPIKKEFMQIKHLNFSSFHFF